MGYSTDFSGSFEIDKPLDDETYNLLKGLSETRRMKRKFPKKLNFGVDGEFYVVDDNEGVVDVNSPPKTQPGLWCQWEIQEDRQTIEWDGGEKFYAYVKWIEYLISILSPKGYVVSGDVQWSGEDTGDVGTIKIQDNVVSINDEFYEETITALEDKVLELEEKSLTLEKKLKTLTRLTLETLKNKLNFTGTIEELEKIIKDL